MTLRPQRYSEITGLSLLREIKEAEGFLGNLRLSYYFI